jgi:hypothetical protein
MARGKPSKPGDTRVSPNGYKYTRTDKKWELTHRLIAEKKLGRTLESDERVRFVDNNRENLDPDNIEVFKQGEASIERRKAQLRSRIDELQAELDELEEETQ